MADDFDAGICSGSWWNSTKMISSSGAMGAAVSCSSAINDTSGSSTSSTGVAFSWLSTADVVEPAGISSASLPFSGFGTGLSHAPPINWNNQTLLSSSTDQRETSFHNNMLQEPLLTYDHQFHMSPLEINQQQQQPQQQFLMPQQQQQQQSGFPVMLQGLYNLEPKPQQHSVHDQRSSRIYQASPTNDPLLNYSSPLKQQQQQSNSSISTNHLQFSNNAPFWNPSAAVIGEAKSGNIYPSSLQQFVTQSFEQKPNCSSITNTTNTKSNTNSTTKKSGSSSTYSEASLKKPRIDKPSPLPALKVRKEKLGDRITALQQLVSPFGKTDTASVLHEAIQYINFLHDQVNMLSTPYLKNGNPMQHQQSSDKSKDGEGTKQDLRSRGLCLVPMESIYPIASETMADFWTPTFGGTYR